MISPGDSAQETPELLRTFRSLIHNRIQVKTQNKSEKQTEQSHKNEPGFIVAIPEVKMADKTLLSEELVNRSKIKAALNIQHGRSFHLQLSHINAINVDLNHSREFLMSASWDLSFSRGGKTSLN